MVKPFVNMGAINNNAVMYWLLTVAGISIVLPFKGFPTIEIGKNPSFSK